jgi:nitrogen fixation NifU-like protein
MDAEFEDLYQEIILNHNRSPRNFRKIENATHVHDGTNPLCGDHYTVYLLIENDIIKDISFQGSGCAISKASASVMSAELKGKTKEEAEHLFDIFHKIVTGEIDAKKHLEEAGKLALFTGVAGFPARVKCASLPWNITRNAIQNTDS